MTWKSDQFDEFYPSSPSRIAQVLLAVHGCHGDPCSNGLCWQSLSYPGNHLSSTERQGEDKGYLVLTVDIYGFCITQSQARNPASPQTRICGMLLWDRMWVWAIHTKNKGVAWVWVSSPGLCNHYQNLEMQGRASHLNNDSCIMFLLTIMEFGFGVGSDRQTGV